MFSRVGIFQRKESLLGIDFDLDFNIYLEIFPIVFLCSKHLVFSHLSYHLYPIYRILFLWKKVGLGFIETTKCCNLFALSLWVSLLCRGDCGGVWFVGIPLSVEVIEVGVLIDYPSKFLILNLL